MQSTDTVETGNQNKTSNKLLYFLAGFGVFLLLKFYLTNLTDLEKNDIQKRCLAAYAYEHNGQLYRNLDELTKQKITTCIHIRAFIAKTYVIEPLLKVLYYMVNVWDKTLDKLLEF